MTSYAVSALTEKRAELGGMIIEAERRLAALRSDRAAVDRVLKLFDPDAAPDGIAPKQHRAQTWSRKTSASRQALDILREAGRPVRAGDVAEALAVGLDVDSADRRATALLTEDGAERARPSWRWRVRREWRGTDTSVAGSRMIDRQGRHIYRFDPANAAVRLEINRWSPQSMSRW